MTSEQKLQQSDLDQQSEAGGKPRKVRAGVIIIPPPTPTIDPKMPAARPIIIMSRMIQTIGARTHTSHDLPTHKLFVLISSLYPK